MSSNRSKPLLPRIFLCWVLITWAAGQALSGAQTAPRVLLLFSNDRLLPANVKFEAGIRAALGAEDGRPAAVIYAEFLDAVRVQGLEHADLFQDYLRFRYRDNPPDVLVAIGFEALEFFLHRRLELFPAVPLAFGGVNQPDLAYLEPLDGVAGVPMEVPVTPGVDALLAMRPQTRELVIVSGASDFDRSLHAEALAQCSHLAERVRIVSCADQSPGEITRRLAALSPDAAVFYLSYFLSPSGETMLPFDMAAMVASSAAAPVIVPYETYLGTGVLGGCVAPFEDQGRDLGAVIRRLAAGEDPARIGILPPTRPRLVFDSRQLKRWGIPAAALPAGSEQRYRTPSIWEQHRGLVIAGGAVLLVQTSLIIALLALRARHLRAEKNLRQSDQRFAGIFRCSPASISIVRQRDGRIVDVNPSWETFFEIPRADALGKTPAELEILVNPESEQQYLEVLGGGRFLQSYEQRVRTGSGKERWRSVTIDLIILGGEPCIVAMAKDITERREMEQARERLTQATRLASLGELAALIAHEVNQPLGAILSNTETAEMLMAGANPPLDEVRQILSDIRLDDLRAGEVVKRVRSLVGRNQTAMEPLDLNDATASVVRLIAHDANRRGVTVRREPAEAIPLVCADRVQIEQVLLNLLLNAMDAMHDTPLAQRLVTLRVTAGDDGWVEVSVADCGHGIDPGRIDRVFDSFFTTKQGGMGLGLALARSIAEAHGGRLCCANQSSGGAVFRLILPSIAVSSGHEAARAGIPDGPCGG